MTALPRLAVGGIAFDEAGRVLLIERGQPPARGAFTLPGGKVEYRESLADAVSREFREETGLEIEVGPLVTLVERITDDGDQCFHYVIADYLVFVRGGTLTAGDDAASARWFGAAELPLAHCTAGLLPVIEQARALYLRLRSEGTRGTGEP